MGEIKTEGISRSQFAPRAKARLKRNVSGVGKKGDELEMLGISLEGVRLGNKSGYMSASLLERASAPAPRETNPNPRTIKFRGRSAKTGRWLFGDLIRNRGGICIAGDSLCASGIQGHEDFEIDASTLGQFTGMADRKGGEIYEGDILRERGSCVEMEIAWRGYQFACVILTDGLGYSKGMTYPLAAFDIAGEWEIVGNVHEKKNPNKY